MRQSLTGLRLPSLTVQNLAQIKDLASICLKLDLLDAGHLILADGDAEQEEPTQGPEGLWSCSIVNRGSSLRPRSEASSRLRSLHWASFLRPSLKTLKRLGIDFSHMDAATFCDAIFGSSANENTPELRNLADLTLTDPDFLQTMPLFAAMPVLRKLIIFYTLRAPPAEVSVRSKPGC